MFRPQRAQPVHGAASEAGAARYDTPQMMAGFEEFEWEQAKAADNLRNHGVSFEEAASVFADPLARGQSDTEHSQEERRSLLPGESPAGCSLWCIPSGENAFASSARARRPAGKVRRMKNMKKRKTSSDGDETAADTVVVAAVKEVRTPALSDVPETD